VAERLAELDRKHRPAAILCDAGGPAGSLVADIERADLEVTFVSAQEHAKACGMFYDTVAQGTLHHRGEPALAAALDGAVKRPLGDAWAWSRRSSAVDIAPLVAVTLALYGASTTNPVREPQIFNLGQFFDDDDDDYVEAEAW
jgi:hypothetical protein